MEIFRQGETAEAVDEFGVWNECRIIEANENGTKVSFPGWKDCWDRTVNESEVRKPTQLGQKRRLPLKREVSFYLFYTALHCLTVYVSIYFFALHILLAKN